MKNTNTKHSTRRGRNRPGAASEQGWVLLASVILSAVAASVTVAWARHAVLQKSALEMSSGASETEEATRSGLERTRTQMRNGSPPGCSSVGEEQIVTTGAGDIVTCERVVVDHDTRALRMRADRPGSDFNESANTRARCRVQPRDGSNSSGEHVTRLQCGVGSTILLSPDLIVVSGTQSYTHQTILGIFLLEEGAVLNLDKVVLQGGIVTRAGLCSTNSVITGATRPRVNLAGGTHINPGFTLKDIAILAPDAIVRSESNARINLHGFIAADEIDFQSRGSLHGMVIAESSKVIGSKIVHVGEDRGPRDFPESIETGSERMTAVAFPSRGFTDDEYLAMEAYDATP